MQSVVLFGYLCSLFVCQVKRFGFGFGFVFWAQLSSEEHLVSIS